MMIDEIVDQKVESAVAAGLTGVLKGDKGDKGDAGDGGGLTPVPAWMPTNDQVGAGWLAMQAALLADEARFAKLPRSTGGKVSMPYSFPSQVNHILSALSLPENRHYLAPHTSTTGYTYVADIANPKADPQAPGVGAGTARSSGMVLFPDGEILVVPYCSSSFYVLRTATETAYTLPPSAPGNYAYLGCALWVDNESALLSPHNQQYACLINKRTGVLTQLTGYDFGGSYSCAGVRRCATGEYYFVPHMHNKHVLLDPVTMAFRTLPFDAPGAEAYVGCTNLSSGEIYVATHKAACSVVIDPVAGTKVDTLPPSGAGYIAPTPGLSNFRTCKRVPDGRVVLVPFKHSKAWIYDRATNKHTQPPGTYSEGAVACASLTAMGDVMLWPWNDSAAYKLSTGYGVPIDPQIVTSPLFNGF